MKKPFVILCLLLLFPATVFAKDHILNDYYLAVMRSNYDKYTKITWYQDRAVNEWDYVFYVYIGTKEDSSPWMMLRTSYVGHGRLHMDKLYVETDSKAYEIPLYNVESERKSKDIFRETCDIPVDEELYAMLKDIANSKKLSFRLAGRRHYQDYNVKPSDIECISRTLNAYEYFYEQVYNFNKEELSEPWKHL